MTSKWDVVRALKTSNLAPPSRLLMMMLVDAADAATAEIPADHTPSLTELETWTGLGRSTVARRLNELEASGWVERDRPSVADARSKGAKTRYRLAVGKDESPIEAAPSKPQEDPETTPEASPRAGLVPERDQSGSARAGLGSATAGPVVVPERDSFFIAPHTPLPPTEGEPDGTPDEPALFAAPPSVKTESPGQRANRLTKVYYDRVPMSKFIAVAKIVAKATASGYNDEQITKGLNALADDPGRAVTLNTLRIAIEGGPKRGRDWRDVSNQNHSGWTKRAGNRDAPTPEAVNAGWNRKKGNQ